MWSSGSLRIGHADEAEEGLGAANAQEVGGRNHQAEIGAYLEEP